MNKFNGVFPEAQARVLKKEFDDLRKIFDTLEQLLKKEPAEKEPSAKKVKVAAPVVEEPKAVEE
jgi:CRISPR/Cas system CMR-associated protein Cmr1 (group 7 of RAMP superfamily)